MFLTFYRLSLIDLRLKPLDFVYTDDDAIAPKTTSTRDVDAEWWRRLSCRWPWVWYLWLRAAKPVQFVVLPQLCVRRVCTTSVCDTTTRLHDASQTLADFSNTWIRRLLLLLLQYLIILCSRQPLRSRHRSLRTSSDFTPSYTSFRRLAGCNSDDTLFGQPRLSTRFGYFFSCCWRRLKLLTGVLFNLSFIWINDRLVKLCSFLAVQTNNSCNLWLKTD